MIKIKCNMSRFGKSLKAMMEVKANINSILICSDDESKQRLQKLYPEIKNQIKTNKDIIKEM